MEVKWWLRVLPLLLLALQLPAATILAQAGQTDEVDGREEREEPKAVFLETVHVTGTKRVESLQKVPIAITALDETQLERAGVKDLRDLPLLVPSFNMNSTQTESQGTTLRIRGVGTTGNNIGLESAVGVFMDGVYLSRPGIALGDQLDVEAIEVLRGPQGTLFGRNVTAGALNVRTKAPGFEGFAAFANLTAANFSGANVQGGAAGTLSEDVAYRVSAAYRTQDGFLRSTTGAESRNRDRVLVRGQLLWDIGEATSLRIIGDYADADENCCDAPIILESGGVAVGSFAAAGLPADGGAPVSGFSALENRISNAERFENPYDQGGISAELNHVFGGNVALTYIGAVRDFKAESVQHSDFVGIDVFSVRPEAAGGFQSFDDIQSMTHELRVTGDTEWVSWMLGAYASDEEIVEQGGLGLGTAYTQNMDAMLWNFAFGPVLPAAPLLGRVPMATGGTFGDILAADNQALAFAGGVDSSGSFAQNLFEQDGRSWSLFTNNTFHVSPSFDLVAGLRYVDETKDGSFRQLGGNNQACLNSLFNAGALAAGAAGTGLEVVAATIGGFSAGFACFPFATPALGISILPATFDDTFEDDDTIYTGKAVYSFNQRTTGYLSFVHGFKSGGFNLDPTAAAAGGDPRFDSEKIDSWELGLKSEFGDRRYRLNLALFDYDIEDFQVLQFTGVQFVTFNVPKAESSGVEIELTGRPVAGLDFGLGYTYSDSNYPADCDLGIQTPTVSTLCGAPLTNAPENVVTGSLNWNDTIERKFFYFASAHARYEDARRTSTQPNLAFDIQEANTKLHLRVGFGSYSNSWTVELWGDNVTDERTRNVTFNTPLRVGSRAVFLEAPRTYGVTLRLRS